MKIRWKAKLKIQSNNFLVHWHVTAFHHIVYFLYSCIIGKRIFKFLNVLFVILSFEASVLSPPQIPITGLHFNCSSVKIEGKSVVLHSGIPLPKLPTVEMIHIAASDTKDDNLETLTEKDIVNWFHYGMQSPRIKELM